MGKSSLARQALSYIEDRKIFLGGMIFVNVKGVRELDRFIKEVALNVFNRLMHQLVGSISKQQNFESIVSHLIESINKVTENDKHCIIVIDNAEDLITYEKENFRITLSKFLNECKNLCVLMTSRIPIGTLQDGY
jgi:hypothetical protein